MPRSANQQHCRHFLLEGEEIEEDCRQCLILIRHTIGTRNLLLFFNYRLLTLVGVYLSYMKRMKKGVVSIHPFQNLH